MNRFAKRVALACGVALLTGCAQVPTDSVVRVEPQRTHAADQPIDIIPHPPVHAAAPNQIVGGFLHAMAEGRGDYDVARTYLTKSARERWDPSGQAVIYPAASQILRVNEEGAVLEAEVNGRLDRRGTYTRVKEPYRLDFGLLQEDGEWRLSNPPHGLLLLQDLFDHAFVPTELYWFDPGYRTLVPETIHVPKLRRTPTFLVGQLLAGPTQWLQPAVRSAVPTQVRLAGEVTVTSDGVATVPLSGDLASLDDTDRGLLMAQLAAVLGGGSTSPPVQYLRMQVDGAPYRLPQSDSSGLVQVAQYARYLATNAQSSAQVFGVQEDRVVLVKDTAGGGTVESVPGLLGQPGLGIDKLAVALDSSELALVTQGSTKLWTSGLVEASPPHLVLDRPGLLAPQYSRFAEVWTVSGTAEGSALYLVRDGEAQSVTAPELADVHVTAFRLSPDGVRLVVVVDDNGRSRLAVLRLRREDTITAEGLTYLRLDGVPAAPVDITAVGWRSDRALSLLGSEEGRAEVNPYELSIDAASVRRASTQTWDATRMQTAPYNGRFVALALGQGGTVWRRGDDPSWRRWVSGLSAVAVAG